MKAQFHSDFVVAILLGVLGGLQTVDLSPLGEQAAGVATILIAAAVSIVRLLKQNRSA